MPESEHPGPVDTTHLKSRIRTLAVRGALIVSGARLGRGFIDVFLTIVLARLLTPGAFGIFGMAAIVMRLVDLLQDIGLSAATIQRENITEEQVSSLFWVNVGVGIGLTAIMAGLVGPGLAWFYDVPVLRRVVAVLSLALLMKGIAAQHSALLRRRMKFGVLAVAELAGGLAGGAIAIGMALKGADYWSLVAMPVASAAATSGLSIAASRFRPARPRLSRGVGDLVRFGGNVTSANLATFVMRNLDDVLIGRFFGAHALGLYQKAYELMMAPIKNLLSPLSFVAIPALSRLQNEAEAYRSAYLRTLEKFLLFTLPLAGTFVGSSKVLIPVLLGEKWAEAHTIFAVLSTSMFTQPLAMTVSWLFITQNRTGELLRWTLFSATTAIVAFFAGLPWGPIGIAVGFSGGQILRTPVLLWLAGKSGPVRTRDFYVVSWPFVLAGAGAAATSRMAHQWSLDPLTWTVLTMSLSAGLGAAFLVLLLTGPGRAALRGGAALVKSAILDRGDRGRA